MPDENRLTGAAAVAGSGGAELGKAAAGGDAGEGEPAPSAQKHSVPRNAPARRIPP